MSQPLPPRPRRSAGPAPLRAPGSIRRTSTIDFTWPQGRGGNAKVIGRARDIVTAMSGGPPLVRAEDSFEALLKPNRTIVAIESNPIRPALSRLVGERGGGGLRKVLDEVVPEERRRATPLYLVLDDISGASLVSNWGWSEWDPNWLENARAVFSGVELEKALADRVGICVGLAAGSTAFTPHADRSGTRVPDLRNPEDPEGWHWFGRQTEVGMRRARRIDVRLEDVIVIDSAFQDSASTPAGERSAVHEYSLVVTADPKSLRVLSVEAEPRVLPHPECPAAAAKVTPLVGTPLPELREKVLAELRGTAGCTHLNDALRALADVPMLLRYLNEDVLSPA